MEVFFYQAECGDAARIRYQGDDGLHYNLFIDSGFERTFRHIIGAELKKIQDAGENIVGWIVSHIHDDHIGGVVRYLDTIDSGEFTDLVNQWYYNPPRIYTPKPEKNVSEGMSIGQGDLLYDYLYKIRKLPQEDITAGDELPVPLGLKIKVLSPSPAKLEKLRKKYKHPGIPLEQNEDESVSEAVSAKSHDYNLKLEDFDLDKWTQDTSVENGSSISILTTYKGNNILWLADSHPSDIVKSLKALGYTNKNKLKCSWVKVTHHGSKGNNSNALYSLIECENYLISANGDNNHCLPTKESLARIIRNKHRSEGSYYKFYFTYDNQTLRDIFESESLDIYKKWKFETIFLSEGKYFEFDVPEGPYPDDV
ncbi:MBL fold metallo-hydrolase [Flavobacterium sp. fv08]|uniref:MBL fold metallo-hydrolase n=1 Tax=Flavobacterium sp. fv08 TaxID=1761784 RepID=UPI0008B221E2|nr:MBL fold metallo-hydrolase [Flavobacterium sp. fv08]SEP05950.1 Metallo-beta-lactamase superfamily protein [Flavobacterium sp. fv08]